MLRTSASCLGLLILGACSSPTSVARTDAPASPTPTVQPTSAPTPTPTPVPRVLLIAEASPDWADEAASLSKRYGWNLERVDPADALQHLRESDNPAAVISVGTTLEGELEAAAVGGIPVLVIDVPDVEPSALLSTVVDARYDQAGFLAGVMVGLSSRTGWVGLVTDTGGPNETEYSTGFTQGILWGCPRCQVIAQAADDMSIDRFRANTVDAIFPIPGSSSELIGSSLVEAGFPLLWVGIGGPPSDALLGRIEFDASSAAITALSDLVETGEGKKWTLSIENQTIVPIIIDADRLSQGRQRLLDEVYAALAAGELDIGTE